MLLCLARRVSASLLLALAACGSPATPAPINDDDAFVDAAAALRLRAADSSFVAAFPGEAIMLAQPGIPSGDSPLIGRNRTWGAMYAARFQMGTGVSLRLLLHLRRADEARRAVAGIEAGLSTMEPSGRLPASVPVSVSLGASPSEADVASGAAFFLGDACLGLLALEAAPDRDTIASPSARAALRARLRQALDWLVTTAPLLAAADRRAPNRLLFDARALHGCAAVTGRPSVAAPFVADAAASIADGGWFLEDDGWDTNYQAVALEIGADVLTVLPEGSARAPLDQALRRGTLWMTGRVLVDGRVDSFGNTRTCNGGESFLGTPKQLGLASVVTGLGRNGTRLLDETGTAATIAARRVAHWARDNPDTDPCYESPG